VLPLSAVLALTLVPLLGEASPLPVTLKPGTVAAFDTYVKLTEARNAGELQRGTNLLWIDELKESERAQAYDALKRGEVRMQKLEARQNGEKIRCPAG